MSFSIAAASPNSAGNLAALNARNASYPPLPSPAAGKQASVQPLSVPDNIPSVEIPAPRADNAATPETGRAWRSAKGELRADAAAPPTAAQASDSFSFADLIDVVNPLQHIPGVSWVYQHLTGDKIKPAENVAGGILYGGALGGMLALGMSMFSELQMASASEESDSTIANAATTPVSPYDGKFGGATTPGILA